MAGRPRKPKEAQSSSLVTALKFISAAQRDAGSPMRVFCRLKDGYAMASDGILTACHKIEEDLDARPHTGKLLSALSHCGKNLSITQLENNQLAIKSGKFFAHVPCCAEDDLPEFEPDQPIAPIDDNIKTGFKRIAHLAQEGAQTIILSSILLSTGSMRATNGSVILEFWHGLSLPTLAIPKIFASAVSGVASPLVQFGFSASSVTFWFEDGSWLKSQLFAEQWPDLGDVFGPGQVSTPFPLPAKFYEALRSVEDFCVDGAEKGIVWISPEGISSHKNFKDGASYQLPGLYNGVFAVRQLKNIEGCCEKIYFQDHSAYFWGDKVRGIIMGVQD